MNTSPANASATAVASGPSTKFHPGPQRRPRLSASALQRLAVLVNSLADAPGEPELPLAEVRVAAKQGTLLDLLRKYSGRSPDFACVRSPDGTFDDLNSMLRDAALTIWGREYEKIGVYRNGYCLALGLVLYAIRERLIQVWPDSNLTE
jgi:hypothetical protein